MLFNASILQAFDNSNSLNNPLSFYPFHSVSGIHSMSAISSSPFLCSVSVRRVVSGQSPCPLCSRAGLSARFHTRNTPITSSEDNVSASNTAAPHNSILTVSNERASLIHIVSVSSKLALYDKFSGPSFASGEHSLLLLLNDTERKLNECKEKLRDVRDELKAL